MVVILGSVYSPYSSTTFVRIPNVIYRLYVTEVLLVKLKKKPELVHIIIIFLEFIFVK